MKRVNAVVVGAGAAGGIVAKELSTAGLSVVLLERGKWYTANDCRKDDLRNQRTTVLGNAFGPEDEGNPRVVWDPKRAPHTLLPSEGGYQNNAACVGGGTLSYGAMAWRYMPQDFRMRSIYGAPAGSSLEDWPIGYDDLEPYYEKAEYEIGISGDYSGSPFFGPRRNAHCPCRRCRPIASSKSSSQRRNALGCIPFTSRWLVTACLTTAVARACAAGGASALPAKWMPRTVRRTR
jgi:choline dehydrogenase-like flavoprotein